MIPRGLWNRLSAAECRVGPPVRIAIVLCGWHPHDPRRNEYDEYRAQVTDMDNDPAFEKVSDGGRMLMYKFDHTKVPKKEGPGQERKIRARQHSPAIEGQRGRIQRAVQGT